MLYPRSSILFLCVSVKETHVVVDPFTALQRYIVA
jgi:hypothetical protein